jgi:hypothetical protein
MRIPRDVAKFGTVLDQLDWTTGPAMDPEVYWRQRFDQSHSSYDLLHLLRFLTCDHCREIIDPLLGKVNL